MKHALSALLLALGGLVTAPAVAEERPFKDEVSTADGLLTWDADMINADQVAETGIGVYVAVLDTGLAPNWRDYFPEERIATELGTGFEQQVTLTRAGPCAIGVELGPMWQSTWVGSINSTHGTALTSMILGYFYQNNYDAANGYPLPPLMVRGLAPNATIIPVRVLSDYTVPAVLGCDDPAPVDKIVLGTSETIAAGIRYVTSLAMAGYRPMVMNMSLGGSELGDLERAALDEAIANGVIVVAAAGNSGEAGMQYPAAYPPVISAGSVGWTGEWLDPSTGTPFYKMWWLQYWNPPMLNGSGDVADPTAASDVYLAGFTSRALPGQQLDLLAPGTFVRAPYPGEPGYRNPPSWSEGIGDLMGAHRGNFYFGSGTSTATPHAVSAAALLLEKCPDLVQAQVESILKSTALKIPPSGSRAVVNPPTRAKRTIAWDDDCGGVACDPVGAGLLQVDAALAVECPVP